MKTVIKKYRVIKGGTINRWRVGDIWELIQYDFEPKGENHLCRNRTSYLNGFCLARLNVRHGYFEEVAE